MKLMVGLLTTSIVLDYQEFDPTKGGYEPPYDDFTGEPIDWSKADLTATGLAKRGRVVNVLINGTTGMISFQTFGQTFEWQKFSPRALAVHKPKQALIERGFTPEF